ncbi:complement C1q-like protein 4 isoform X3 [Ruditapes philippinarum]|uniref:complement C1q-like protein 4 isoform X3 n=1 Tax=Ruditapes philippinarum TaxID=129788 RepID=UPI00295BE311|nr:complement C1q-like protein 4 isoform X3 [Ruditapes philippinarum]
MQIEIVTTACSQAESQCVYTMENVIDKMARLGLKLETIEKRLEKIESRQDALSTDSLDALRTPMVVFRIQLNKYLGRVTTGTVIKFDQVDLNLGNAYNDGYFTAPFNGTYIFSMVLGNPSGKQGAFFMRKNGVGIEYAIAGHTTGWNIGGVSTVAFLDVGDRVWVTGEGHVSGANADRYHTGFSGMLVNSY